MRHDISERLIAFVSNACNDRQRKPGNSGGKGVIIKSAHILWRASAPQNDQGIKRSGAIFRPPYSRKQRSRRARPLQHRWQEANGESISCPIAPQSFAEVEVARRCIRRDDQKAVAARGAAVEFCSGRAALPVQAAQRPPAALVPSLLARSGA